MPTATPSQPAIAPFTVRVDNLHPVRKTDNDFMLGIAAVLGVSHHFMLLRVVLDSEGIQQAANPEDEEAYKDACRLFEDSRYATVRVPGYDGDYIAIMHPFDD